MSNDKFKQRFLDILWMDEGEFQHPGAAKLIRKFVFERVSDVARERGMRFDEVIDDVLRMLMSDPFYGDGSPDVGGVNVYRFKDGERKVEFTASHVSTWMSIGGIVAAAYDGIKEWWDPEWDTVVCNE